MKRIQYASASLLTLVEDVLDFSRIESGHVVLADETVNIYKLAVSIRDIRITSYNVCYTKLLRHLIPGDPVEIMLGEAASATDREALRVALGLDQPVMLQFTHYLHGLLQFDLGTSLQSRRPVTDLLLERLPATLLLAAVTLAVTLVLALPLGMLAAVRRGSPWDGGARNNFV